MNNKTVKTLLLALYAVFLAALYQVVAIPLALDFSLLGLALIFTAGALGYLSVPKPHRKRFALLSMLILIVSYGVNFIYSDHLIWRFLEFPLMFLVLAYLAKLYGNIRFTATLTVVIALGLAQVFVPLTDAAFLSNLNVVKKTKTLDEHPLYPLYPLGNVEGTLYSVGDLRRDLEDEELGYRDSISDKDLLEKDPLLLLERRRHELDNMHVLKFDPQTGYAKEPVRYDDVRNGQEPLPFDPLGYTGLPFSVSDWEEDREGNLRQEIKPVDDPSAMIHNLLEPLTLPVTMTERADRAFEESRRNYLDLQNQDITRWETSHTPYETYIGRGRLLPNAGEQPVYQANNELRIYDAKAGRRGEPIAVLQGTFEEPITPDLLLADINADGQDELLLNTVPAKILRLQADGNWQTLWTSGEESFRFEFVEPRDGAKPLIAANSPSLVRDQPARYLTGFTWLEEGAELVREWRVFEENLVRPFVLQESTWVTQIYNNHIFYVLRPMTVPVETILAAAYLALLLAGYGYQLTQRGRKRHA